MAFHYWLSLIKDSNLDFLNLMLSPSRELSVFGIDSLYAEDKLHKAYQRGGKKIKNKEGYLSLQNYGVYGKGEKISHCFS